MWLDYHASYELPRMFMAYCIVTSHCNCNIRFSYGMIYKTRGDRFHTILKKPTLRRAGYSGGRAALHRGRQLSRSGMARWSSHAEPQSRRRCPFRCLDSSTSVSPTIVAPQAGHKRRSVETGCERFGCTCLDCQGDKADCRSFDLLLDFGELKPRDSRNRRASDSDLFLPIAACPRPIFSWTNN